MKQISCDILIVGSALTGIIASYSLSLLDYKIVIVDQSKFLSKNSLTKESFNKDTRTTAIAEGSKEFLENLKLWKNLSKFAEPIKTIKVLDRSSENIIDFANYKINKNLGYIIKNKDFLKTICGKILKNKNITILDQTRLKDINNSSNQIICRFNNCLVKSKLLIAADGKNSTVRKLKNEKVYFKKYNEKALVVNFEHQKNHKNCAYEYFYKNGPLAILPMKKEKNFQSSLIWSNQKTYLDSLVQSNEKIIKELLEEKIYKTVGKIIRIKSIQTFPLSAHINYKFYNRRLIYIGDAAHSIHPIAGQGWNLGLRDIKKLFYVAKQYKELGIEIGKTDFCKKYNSECYYDSYRLFQITDKLNKIFMSENNLISLFRTIGFNFIQKRAKLKKQITNFAMGF